MKEEILQKLKKVCGENTSISERTLITFASVLSADITEENQIDAAIEKYKPLFKDFDGNISSVAAGAVKHFKESLPVAPAPAPPAPPSVLPVDDQVPAWAKALKESMELERKAMEDRFVKIEKSKQVDGIISSARTDFYTKFRVNDAERALCDKSLELYLKLNPEPDSVDSVITGWKSQYEDIRQAQGFGGLVLASTGGDEPGIGVSKTALTGLKEKLQREGKLPVPAQN